MADQWVWWRKALAGTLVDSEIGKPRAGFWKGPNDEAVAIWWDGDQVFCERQKYDGSRMRPDEIDELYSSASRYPVEEAVYRSVAERGEPWPEHYKTRLTLKEIGTGIIWTPELGRKKIGDGLKAAATSESIDLQRTPLNAPSEPAPAGIGHNNPPEEMTPDAKLRAEISQASATVKAWLGEIGGAPRNKPEADQLADFATRFGTLSKLATDQHKVEKAPVLQQGREIDAKWFGLRDNASLARGRCLTIAQTWIDAENERLAAEARKASEEAAAAAAKAAKQYDAPITPPPPVEPEKITGIGNMRTVAQRTRQVWEVTDPRAYGAHVLARENLPQEILDALHKIAQRDGAAGVDAPGITKETKRSVA